MKGGLLLDVVVGEGATILQLLASKDQALLVRGNALLVLDLGLDIVDGVRALNLKGDSLSSEGLHEDLHATTQTQDKVEGGLLLDVVVSEGTAILQLLASEDETLLVRRNALLVLDLGLDIVDGVRRLHLKGDGLARQCLHKDLHLEAVGKEDSTSLGSIGDEIGGDLLVPFLGAVASTAAGSGSEVADRR